MKKTTIPFMLALLATAHIAKADTFTATITMTGLVKPQRGSGFSFTITANETAGNLPKTSLNTTSTTQVTLVDGQQYTLWGQFDPGPGGLWPVVWGGAGDYVFKASKSTPNIKLSANMVVRQVKVNMSFSQS